MSKTRYVPCQVCGTHALTRAVHDRVYCPTCKKRIAAENQAKRRRTGGRRGRPAGGDGIWLDYQGDVFSKCHECERLDYCREAVRAGMPLYWECEPKPTVTYVMPEHVWSDFDKISLRI